MNSAYNRTWAEIDLDNIKHNFQEIKRHLHPGCKLMAVIKADAYGHGAVPLSRFYTDLGVDYLAVAALDEAKQLRIAGITAPILILGNTPVEYAQELIEYHLTQTVFHEESAKLLSDIAVLHGTKLKVHVKVDTGMSRIGVVYQDEQRDAQAVDTIKNICSNNGLEVEGIFTHFAVADELGNPFTFDQFHHFTHLLKLLEQEGITFPIRHCSNSGATLNYPEMQLDMVRAGLILYGVFPAEEKPDFDLRPAMCLKTTVTNVKTIAPGTTISYGRHFTAQKEMKIATIPVGYADGISRVMSGKISFLINGQLAPVLGNICMDQCMVDVSHIENVQIGDLVTIFGGPEDHYQMVNKMAEAWGTINYEVICQISKRIPRIYLMNDRRVSSFTYLV